MTQAARVLHRILIERGLTVACAESLTVGGVASHLGEYSGSSAYFQGGVVAYNIDAKVALLHVDRKNAEACNCVSEQTAREMAHGVANLFGAHIGIATTGYAERCPEQGIDAPYAWVAIVLLHRELEKCDYEFTRKVIPDLSPLPVNWNAEEQAAEIKQVRRIEVQEEVAYEAIELLVEALEPGALEADEMRGYEDAGLPAPKNPLRGPDGP